MSTTIESLELEIVSNSKSAESGIDALAQSLVKLKSVTAGKLGLTAVVKELESFNKADVNGAKSKMVTLSAALSTLSNLPKPNISGYINPLKAIPAALSGLKSADMTSLYTMGEGLVSALAPLSKLEKSNLSGYINSLKQIPKVMKELEAVDMGAFASKMQAVATAMKPLADEMEKVSNGFSAMPTKIQKLIRETDKIPSSNKRASFSFTDLYHAVKSGINILKRVGSAIYSVVEKSADYTENLNLFKVAMGQYAEEAFEYAEKVSNTLGIDTSEWIRAQGVFMTLATGFGVAGDRAAIMSKNLTQLGYDLASFYNMDTETAMLKLKSGLAGELEPLRDIGYDLSQAKLEATALELGITKSVSAMTQAEKAQLRYYAIMNQVTTAQGDMARTLDDPANQMRIFKAQCSMAAREIGNVFIPALNAILPYAIAVAKVIGTIASSIAGLFGYENEDEDFSKTTNAVAENTESISENMEEAQEEAKKLKSYLLGIDELNVINPNEGSAIDDTSGWVDFELPDYSEKFLEGAVDSRVNQIVESMKEWLGITEDIDTWSELLETRFGHILATVGLIGGGLLLWKIGTGVVDFVKNFGAFAGTLKLLGAIGVIGAAIAGAQWLIVNADDTVTKIGAIISGAALAVGAILAFTGINLPLGIALMAVGAISMATAIALNTDALSDEVKGVIAIIASAVSAALLVVGAILAFTGVNIPLGVTLMAGGAVAMATAIFPNWDKLSASVQNVISIIMAAVGGAALALGAILAFSGVAIPLGIGLMLVGAASLGTAVALNWDSIIEALRGPVGKTTALISGALLALGAILLFTGVGIPLGLGLILAGAGGLATVVAVNWDFLLDKVKGIWDGIKNFWNTYIAPIFTADWWIDLGKTCINGLITGFEAGINGIISMFESMINWIVDGLNKISFDVPDWVPLIGGKKFGFDIPRVSFGRVSIPRLADGAYDIPSGQMFIAREAGAEMVGTIGRKTAVANNDQIVSGIAGGVAEANEEQNALLREQNSLLRAILEKDSGVYLDGKNLANSVEKYQRERGRVLITGGVV